jgi:hypothetical protein
LTSGLLGAFFAYPSGDVSHTGNGFTSTRSYRTSRGSSYPYAHIYAGLLHIASVQGSLTHTRGSGNR